MASILATLAEAVTAALNAAQHGTFALKFEAQRVYIPEFTPDQAGTDLSVLVVGRGLTHTLAGRNTFFGEFAVDVGIQQRLEQGADPTNATGNARLDELMELAEQVAAFFPPGAAYGDGAKLVSKTSDPLFIPQHLREHKVFTSVVTLNFKRT